MEHYSFYNLGLGAFFWSSTVYRSPDARYVDLFYYNAYISFNDYSKEFGFSVRCVKDYN